MSIALLGQPFKLVRRVSGKQMALAVVAGEVGEVGFRGMPMEIV